LLFDRCCVIEHKYNLCLFTSHYCR